MTCGEIASIPYGNAINNATLAKGPKCNYYTYHNTHNSFVGGAKPCKPDDTIWLLHDGVKDQFAAHIDVLRDRFKLDVSKAKQMGVEIYRIPDGQYIYS